MHKVEEVQFEKNNDSPNELRRNGKCSHGEGRREGTGRRERNRALSRGDARVRSRVAIAGRAGSEVGKRARKAVAVRRGAEERRRSAGRRWRNGGGGGEAGVRSVCRRVHIRAHTAWKTPRYRYTTGADGRTPEPGRARAEQRDRRREAAVDVALLPRRFRALVSETGEVVVRAAARERDC